jgi:hypothetical protein
MLANVEVYVVVVAATLVALGSCVLLHYEGLLLVSRRLSRQRDQRRVGVLYAVFSIIALHAMEICIFGITLWLLVQWPATGSVQGPASVDLFECLYLSATTFSTVGFGDIAPVGPIRFLSGTEALTGFVLITWSASFTYLEMERFWRAEEKESRSSE